MYYIQPWMLAVIVPLALIRESMLFCHLHRSFPLLSFAFRSLLGQQLLYQLHVLNKQQFLHLGRYASILGSSALLAFSLEFSEYLLVSNTSSLTLSVSGIFKVMATVTTKEKSNSILFSGNRYVVFGRGIQQKRSQFHQFDRFAHLLDRHRLSLCSQILYLAKYNKDR